MSIAKSLLVLSAVLGWISVSYALEKSVFGGDQMTIEVPSTPGQVDVFVEQSDDLVNWTAVAPGSFQGSIQKRFFRLRAVEK